MVTVSQPKRDPGEIIAEAAARAARLHKVGLHPNDTVRALKPGRTQTWLTGTPHDTAPDGSVTCILDTQFRTLRPEVIEVKRRGPRGGINWVPLVPEEDR